MQDSNLAVVTEEERQEKFSKSRTSLQSLSELPVKDRLLLTCHALYSMQQCLSLGPDFLKKPVLENTHLHLDLALL